MKSKKRVRLQAADSREKLLKAALSLIAKKGWSEVSFQMIAEKAGTTASNALYHFPSRPKLLIALLERITQNNYRIVSDGLRAEQDAFERLKLHFEKNLEWAEKYPEEAGIIIQIYSEACTDRDFAEVFAGMTTKAQERIREYLLAGTREKIMRFDTEPELMARLLHNLLVGAFIECAGRRTTSPIRYTGKEWSNVIAELTGYER
ncbi:MAG: TetR/AcrR family transcriptional regulator [Bdellovibrionia bacterium]